MTSHFGSKLKNADQTKLDLNDPLGVDVLKFVIEITKIGFFHLRQYL